MKLQGYKLCFNYFSSTRKAGAANIVGHDTEVVYGLLMELTLEEREIIRRKEGHKKSYDEIVVSVTSFDGVKISEVITYKVLPHREQSNHQPPSRSYLNLLINNAIRYGFPEGYIKYLKSIPTSKV